MVLDERFDASLSRPIARRMARHLYRWGYTADQVSILAAGFGVMSGVCFTGSGL